MTETTLGVTRREALKRGIVIGGAAVAWATPTAQAFGMTSTVAQGASGGAGCTPGYWKNHVDEWRDLGCIDPDAALGDLFGFSGDDCDGALERFADSTAEQALRFKGGNGLGGKLEIFFRAAVAARLNECFLSDYPWTSSDLANLVDDAILSCDEAVIVSAARQLDVANNIGCPFSKDAPPGSF